MSIEKTIFTYDLNNNLKPMEDEEEIKIWEKENFPLIEKWLKDFEKGTLTFTLTDGTKQTFKIK